MLREGDGRKEAPKRSGCSGGLSVFEESVNGMLGQRENASQLHLCPRDIP